LARYDAARLILEARRGFDRLVLAQATADKPGLPSELGDEFRNEPSGPSVTSAPRQVPEQDLGRLAETLLSLEEAYQSEIKTLRDKVRALAEGLEALESGQARLLNKAGNAGDSKRISVHGLGRAWGASRRDFGFEGLEERSSAVFLDLRPEGVVSKEVSWNALLRLGSEMRPDAEETLTFRRMTVSFRPGSLAVTMGDFEESYTPLVMWNRDALDMAFAPEFWSRRGDRLKYESFLNHEPAWPLRGLKAEWGTRLPGVPGTETFKVSALAHMIRNGLDDTTSGGWYFGPEVTTDWLFGGTALLKLGEIHLGGKTIRPDIASYGLMLDQPLNGMEPGSPYDPLVPSTWVHRYLVGSVKPSLKTAWGGGREAGGALEYAYARYQDDLRNAERVVGDFAVLGEVYARIGRSKVSFQYLSVGPQYYSPMAQTRQDAVTQTSVVYDVLPDAVMGQLRGSFFMPSSPRAGGLFTFFDRTRDAVFPYGLATPNRQGAGLTADLRGFRSGSLRLLGSFYQLKEIDGNLVLNATQTGFVAVEEPAGALPAPVRAFTYVNAGPSLDLGPFVGFPRAFTIGANLRLERTSGRLGRLTGFSKVGFLHVEALKELEFSTAYSVQTAVGDEAGYGGTLWARAPYLFDNTDLGAYGAFHVDGQVDGATFSGVVKPDDHSRITLDAGFFRGDMSTWRPASEEWKNQFVEMTYEVQF
jgi:hypothetical protein